MTKKELRKIYREKREALTPLQILKMDDLLLIQFQRLAFEDDVHILLNYFPIEQRVEIDTHLFSRYLMHSIPGLHVAYPKIDFKTSTMHPMLVDDKTAFEDNIYSISEPVDARPVDAEDLDIVFVPLLAFDKHGYRVGYGKGFYDRFLKQCRNNVVTIGFSYFEAVDKIDDTNQFDVPLNFCITPQKLYEF